MRSMILMLLLIMPAIVLADDPAQTRRSRLAFVWGGNSSKAETEVKVATKPKVEVKSQASEDEVTSCSSES
jgi:hypothetical protein